MIEPLILKNKEQIKILEKFNQLEIDKFIITKQQNWDVNMVIPNQSKMLYRQLEI